MRQILFYQKQQIFTISRSQFILEKFILYLVLVVDERWCQNYCEKDISSIMVILRRWFCFVFKFSNFFIHSDDNRWNVSLNIYFLRRRHKLHLVVIHNKYKEASGYNIQKTYGNTRYIHIFVYECLSRIASSALMNRYQ